MGLHFNAHYASASRDSLAAAAAAYRVLTHHDDLTPALAHRCLHVADPPALAGSMSTRTGQRASGRLATLRDRTPKPATAAVKTATTSRRSRAASKQSKRSATAASEATAPAHSAQRSRLTHAASATAAPTLPKVKPKFQSKQSRERAVSGLFDVPGVDVTVLSAAELLPHRYVGPPLQWPLVA